MEVTNIIIIRFILCRKISLFTISSQLVRYTDLSKINLIGSIKLLLNRFRSYDSSFSPYFIIVARTCFLKSSSDINPNSKPSILPPLMIYVSLTLFHMLNLPELRYQPVYTEIEHYRRIAIHLGMFDISHFHAQ